MRTTRVFLPANQRRLGMVFQSYAVWPHMSVFDNTAFPLRMCRGSDGAMPICGSG